MDDVTNYMHNVGKDLSEQVFDLRITYDEMMLIKALAQNPHENYMREPETRRVSSKLFEELKEITGYAQRRYLLSTNSESDLDF